jgi:hypothetical protein
MISIMRKFSITPKNSETELTKVLDLTIGKQYPVLTIVSTTMGTFFGVMNDSGGYSEIISYSVFILNIEDECEGGEIKIDMEGME